MKEIEATVGDLGVQVPHLARLALALEFGQPLLLVPIPAWRFDFGSVRARRQRFQTQVDADLLGSRGRRFFRAIDGKIHVPPLAGVLAEAARLDWAGYFPAVPKPELLTRVANGIAVDPDSNHLEGNPARRTPAAPAQLALLELLAAVGVLLAHGLYCLRMQAEFLTASSRQLVQVEPGRPAPMPAQGVFLGFVAEVPHEIDRPRQLIQFGAVGRILDSVAEGLYHEGIICITKRTLQQFPYRRSGAIDVRAKIFENEEKSVARR